MRVIVVSSWYWEGWDQILSIWLNQFSSLMVVTNVYNTKAENHLLITTFALNPQLEHWRSWFLWARIHSCHVADSWVYCISVFHEAFKARPRHLWLLLAIFRQSFQAKLIHHHIIIFMQLFHCLCYICPWHLLDYLYMVPSRPIHFIKGIFILFTLANLLSRQQDLLSFSRWLLQSFWFCCQIVEWSIV